MSTLEPAALLERIVDIARRAGEEILEVYASQDAGARTKADDSPVTLADLRAHSVIEGALQALTPEIPLLSEESAQLLPYEQRARWSRYWLVDPLDGTREFLARNGEFTVNIALIEAHAPTLGVVHVPVRKTTYAGLPGVGAWRRHGTAAAEPIHVQARAASPVRVVGSKSHRGTSLDGLLAQLGPHELLSVGSSLKFCLIAEGTADLYPRLGPTSEWDTAAAQAVVCAAGGAVVKLDGTPLTYNAKAEILNPHFLVYADRQRDWLALLKV
ncbi:3'-5'-bisphosphate nucleotidase [Steroidobacter denitrificans]|uniref:3'(2'),5'-bisphosphate nucleotidase CysQ n=1 Tax=Steroidobacter denitrificans TaxID=465721 RepID=A0A127F7H1_STEDE|nr:3'(2'),5'-bisphosphate nucleotidase CysQ [Steroidobacter denitrificans]AMN45545.1 3'-5'-bisphosphate nucleotidase [Steroidobacter denitrificans]